MKTKGTRGLHRAAALLLAILMMVSLLSGSNRCGSGEETVAIGSYDELAAFAQAVNGGDSYAGRTVRLTKNLSLGGIAWTPIGTKDAPFSGTFDGGYRVITGLLVEGGSASYQGLFGYIKTGTVQNLVVEGTVSGGSYAGRRRGLSGGRVSDPLRQPGGGVRLPVCGRRRRGGQKLLRHHRVLQHRRGGFHNGVCGGASSAALRPTMRRSCPIATTPER